jgi:hypothetical protein
MRPRQFAASGAQHCWQEACIKWESVGNIGMLQIKICIPAPYSPDVSRRVFAVHTAVQSPVASTPTHQVFGLAAHQRAVLPAACPGVPASPTPASPFLAASVAGLVYQQTVGRQTYNSAIEYESCKFLPWAVVPPAIIL